MAINDHAIYEMGKAIPVARIHDSAPVVVGDVMASPEVFHTTAGIRLEGRVCDACAKKMKQGDDVFVIFRGVDIDDLKFHAHCLVNQPRRHHDGYWDWLQENCEATIDLQAAELRKRILESGNPFPS